MSGSKNDAVRKGISSFRFVFIVAAFGLIVHMNHNEYAKHVDNNNKYNKLSDTSHDTSNTLSPVEEFYATAYCLNGITKSGVPAAPGRVATDPDVIPLGSVIYIDSPILGGIYQVFDTGSLVKGKIIDIFIPNYDKCMEFGRRMVKVKVLRYGFLGYPPSSGSSP